MTNKPTFSQLNALSLASQLGLGVLVSALQSLRQHPVIHCILSNNLFGASVVFPDNAMSYVTPLHYCAVGNASAGRGHSSSPCPTHACQPPGQALASIALLSAQVMLDAYTLIQKRWS